MAATIRVGEHSLAVHLVREPGTQIFTTITPSVTAVSLDIIVFEVTEVVGAVAPGELSLPLLAPFDILTLVASSIAPCFDTLTVLLIILPLALINRTVEVQIFSFPVGFVVSPFSNIDVTIGMDQPTESM